MKADLAHLLPQKWPTLEELERLSKAIGIFNPLATFSINELMRVTREMQMHLDAHFGQYGLSLGRYVTRAAIIARAGQEVTPAIIADDLGVSRATMTGLLDGLERDGLIKRKRRADDRRKVGVVVTPKAKSLLEDFLPVHASRIEEAMSVLSDQEKKSLVRLLEKLSDGFPRLAEGGKNPARPRKGIF